MSSTRTLIAAITLSLIGPISVPSAPGVNNEVGSLATPVSDALSPGTYRETPIAATDDPITAELPGATVRAETPEQIAIVEWCLGRFDLADLELPHVDIEMRSFGRCPDGNGGQNAGSLSIGLSGEYRITICGTRRTLLHELGHVWDNHTLGDEERQAFRALRGLEAWNNAEHWDQAGGEHLAETLTWALDEVYWIPSRIPDNSLEELAEAYETLTGKKAPILSIAPRQRREADDIGDRQILDTTDLAPGDDLG